MARTSSVRQIPVPDGLALTAADKALISALPLFSLLPPSVLRETTADAFIVRYGKGDVLFHEGDEADYLHIVLDGEVGLVGAVGSGEDTVVEIMKAGEIFIAAAVLTGKPYLMSAVAWGVTRVLQLSAQPLMHQLRSSPDLALAMLTSLAGHYRALVREVKDLKLKSANQRLALYLVGLAHKREGSAIVRLPHSKGVIAARVGIRPETLSRAFAMLKEQGVVIDRHAVAIADVAALAAYCGFQGWARTPDGGASQGSAVSAPQADRPRPRAR